MKASKAKIFALNPVLVKVADVRQRRIPLKQYSNKFLREAWGYHKADQQLLDQYNRLQNALKMTKLKKRHLRLQLNNSKSKNYSILQKHLLSNASHSIESIQQSQNKKTGSSKPDRGNFAAADQLQYFSSELPLQKRILTDSSDDSIAVREVL